MIKVFLLMIAFGVGYLFDLMNIPAGWLLGAMLVGVYYRLMINEISYPNLLFDISLAVIGVSIGISIKVSMFKEVASYLFPLAVSLVILLVASWILGKVLGRYSNLDRKTALFCCLPAGASVMMALSREYKANMGMVAAFQTVRIMMLVATIPIVAGFMTSYLNTKEVESSGLNKAVEGAAPMWLAMIFYLVLVVVTLLLSKKWRIPIAPFLYSIVLAFVFHAFVQPLPSMPNLGVGLGMAMLGVIIGVRFDRKSLSDIKQIGWTSLWILVSFFFLTFVVTYVFYLMTPLDFITSLLAIVPAGAPQMASVAASLDLDGSVVAAMQVIRLLILILFIPMLVPFLVTKGEKTREEPVENR
ncbi:AbrB family transcriptional regulator [Guptibacillus algicola]|uniref:AbrB family transcriptional regulator n=1 Tax=Guptibacillus algicola TaxID=225844 RepID=UPI001CD729D8|nr:AbrB family transcriptional regulator [Alkalihalobacillus algicola]MCA0987207.1 AbrB family transcriptional regulator [Alkalihalobacillus algicola]